MAIMLAFLLALMLSINSVGQEPATGLTGGIGSRAFIGVRPDNVILPTDHDLGNPSTARLVPGDATVHGRSGADAGDVLAILGTVKGSQVRPSTVQPITVDMVTFAAIVRDQPQQFTMQQTADSSPILYWLPDRVSVFVKMPAPLSDPRSIGGVDQRVGSRLAAVRLEGDQRGQLVPAPSDGMRSELSIAGISAWSRAEDARSLSGPPRSNSEGLTAVSAYDINVMARSGGVSLLPLEATGLRARQPFTGVDRTDTGEKVAITLSADARDGTLVGHREASLPGVGPGQLTLRRGLGVPQFYHDWGHSIG